MMDLESQQEILMNIADMALDVFTMESALLRTEKLYKKLGEESSQVQFTLTKVYLSDALERIHIAGKHAVCAFAEGDELRMMLLGLKRFTKSQPYNTIGMRQELAEIMIQENRYCF